MIRPEAAFPRFRDALETWTREAISVLRNGQLYSTDGHFWEDAGPNSRRRVFSPTHDWLVLDSAIQTSAWEHLTAAIAEEPRVSSQINNLVGTDETGLIPIDQQTIARSAVQPFRPVQRDNIITYPFFDVSKFDERYARIENFLLSNTLEFETSILLVGVDFGHDKIHLAPDISIERLSDEEMWYYGSIGILQRIAPNFDDYAAGYGYPRHVLRLYRTLPKRVGTRSNEPPRSNLWHDGISNTRERLATAISLVRSSAFRYGGTATKCLTFGLPGFVLPSSYPAFPSAIVLNQQEINEIPIAWDSVKPAGGLHPSIATALRRLTYSSERQRAEDKILDSMIAAEAVILADNDKVDLKYRFALRGAWYLAEQPDNHRRKEFEFLKAAYNVRSAIAHGGAPKSKDLRVDGAQLTLDEFAQHLESRTRLILKRAIARERPRDVLPRKWDDDLVGPLQRDEPAATGQVQTIDDHA